MQFHKLQTLAKIFCTNLEPTKVKSKETKRKSWIRCPHTFSLYVKTFEMTFFESLCESSFQYYMCSVTR